MSSTSMTTLRKSIENHLVERAQTDAAFRQLILSDPHAALKSVFGTDPVPGMTITVIEEKPGNVTLVLPAPLKEDELPDELLDMAAGGIGFSAFIEYGPSISVPKPKKS